jgi:sec-independent protein translocase protein TatA
VGEFSAWHWLIVALVFMVLFGAKKLPDSARSLGQALRLFKQETSRMGSDAATGDRPKADAAQGSDASRTPDAPQSLEAQSPSAPQSLHSAETTPSQGQTPSTPSA